MSFAEREFSYFCYVLFSGQPVDFNDKQWSDVHMIAGALKWYFRELPDPLIPFDKFDEYVNAISKYCFHENFLFLPLVSFRF